MKKYNLSVLFETDFLPIFRRGVFVGENHMDAFSEMVKHYFTLGINVCSVKLLYSEEVRS